jgi:hypothetical protein
MEAEVSEIHSYDMATPAMFDEEQRGVYGSQL